MARTLFVLFGFAVLGSTARRQQSVEVSSGLDTFGRRRTPTSPPPSPSHPPSPPPPVDVTGVDWDEFLAEEYKQIELAADGSTETFYLPIESPDGETLLEAQGDGQFRIIVAPDFDKVAFRKSKHWNDRSTRNIDDGEFMNGNDEQDGWVRFVIEDAGQEDGYCCWCQCSEEEGFDDANDDDAMVRQKMNGWEDADKEDRKTMCFQACRIQCMPKVGQMPNWEWAQGPCDQFYMLGEHAMYDSFENKSRSDKVQ